MGEKNCVIIDKSFKYLISRIEAPRCTEKGLWSKYGATHVVHYILTLPSDCNR